MIANAKENRSNERPVTRLFSIRIILYRKRNAKTTQMTEIFASIKSL
jgi:hypothetical protein